MKARKKLPGGQQPNNRIIAFGAGDLKDAELLTFLLGRVRGRSQRNTEELATLLLSEFGSLHELSKASFSEIKESTCMSETRIAQVMVAIELGRRIMTPRPVGDLRLSDSQIVYSIYAPKMQLKNNEVFYAALTDVKLRWIKEIKLAEGSLFECVLRPSDAFARILKSNAVGVVFIHNHPSGDPLPSVEDRELTARLVQSGKLLGLMILDHVIIGSGCYYSFADNGALNKNNEISKNPEQFGSAKGEYSQNTNGLFGMASDVLIFPDPPLPSPFDENLEDF